MKAIQASEDNYLSICSEFSKCLAFQHPRLVKSFEYLAGSDRNMVCLAMKYYKFGDLEYVCKNLLKKTPPSDELLISLITQIGEGLDYLHTSQQVIHRDIKPSNIMVEDFDESTSSISIAIGDFGVSKQANIAHTYAGTFYYVSPELFLSKTTSFSTDIYSLGVMMYMIICGKFQTYLHQPSIAQQIFSDGEKVIYPKIENEMKQHLTNPAIISLVMRMLAKEPEDRPTASELSNFGKTSTC